MNNSILIDNSELKPVIKWAGGKSKIISQFSKLYSLVNCDRYFDLFCGSLSLPLELKPKKAVFNDINIWLINLYKNIKDNLPTLKKKLKKLNEKKYNCAEEFDIIRNKYNSQKEKEELSEDELTEMAAIFVYLNKRSFNGLYRENQSGKYNVPFRNYNSSIYNETELNSLSKYFNDNKIKFKSKPYQDYKIKKFRKGDLVYIDPPYYPCNKSSFTSYWKTPFLVEEQEKLAKFCKKLDKKGINFIVSNAPCKEIEKLYEGFNMEKFYIGRQMRSAEGKSDVYEKKDENNEILIWNFDIQESNDIDV